MLKGLLKKFDVATTALLTNYWKDKAKSRENWPQLTISQGEREKDLFKDPYLNLFYDEDVAKEAEERLDKRMWLPLATRTRYFRQTISEAVKGKHIQQILNLGSGFDTLAVRKAKYSEQHAVRFFEIDRPEILACKKAIFNERHLETNATYVGLDYTEEDFMSQLKTQGLDPEKPTLVLWEGNTFYLTVDQVIRVLSILAEQFPHLLLSFDFMHKEIQKENDTLESFAKKKSPFQSFFTVDEMLEICQSVGLSCHSHFNTAELAQDEYKVDKTPYHTAKPYSVITMSKGI
jgi:methyltransferase (TIGR00027 family)